MLSEVVTYSLAAEHSPGRGALPANCGGRLACGTGYRTLPVVRHGAPRARKRKYKLGSAGLLCAC